MNNRMYTPLWVAACALAAEVSAEERCYSFYQPQVKHVVIHEGKLAVG